MQTILALLLLAAEPIPVFPTYSNAGLPATHGKVNVAKLTDKNQGLMYSNGSTWQNVGAAWPIYRIEDFGGVANDSSGGARAANNTAWTNMMAAIGSAVGSFTATYHVQFGPGTYYFSGPLKFMFSLYVEGAADSFIRPTTILSFPPTGDGLFIAYDSLDPTYFGGSSTVKNLQVQHDQTLATWQASHSYGHGDSVQPTNASGWTGYVFVNNGSTATSGSSEPAWSSDLQTPTGLNGSNVTDGGVTWTATATSLIDIRANNIDMDSVDVTNAYGNGIFVYGNTTNSLADGNTFRNVSTTRNLSAGILIRGNDANENKYYNVTSLFNCTWGIYDAGFLGNSWYGADSSFNGPSCKTQYYDAWRPSITPPVGTELVPTVPNGYAYVSAGTGSTGSSEPTWPTTIGLTVSDGAITWTCHRKYSGGPIKLGGSFGGQIFGLYQEDSDLKTINNGIIVGLGSPQSFDPTSIGAFWAGTTSHSYQTFGSGSPGNATYNAFQIVGDAPGDLQFGQYRVLLKDNSDFQDIFTQYQTTGFMEWFSSAGVGDPFMQMPFGNSTIGARDSVYFPHGVGIGVQGAGNTVRLFSNNGVPPSAATGIQGDKVPARLGLYDPGGAGWFQKISDGSSRWEEAGWSSPTQGRVIEPLSEFGETDLHFLIDDVRTQFNAIFGAPETITSRKGSYTITWVGGGSGLNVISVPQGTNQDSDIAYDFSRRSRKTLVGTTSSSYGKIAANAAHSLPTSGAVTLSCAWYAKQNSTVAYTLFGYSTTSANSGYQLTVKSDNTLLFSAQNTASAAFVSLNSTATVATNQYHVADVVFDTVNDAYQLWLDGSLVASASGHTGTLGTTTGDIGVGGLLTNSATLTNPTTSDQYPMEIERETRALSPKEIALRARQFIASGGVTSLGPDVNNTNITAHSGGGGVGSCTQLAAVGFVRVDTVAGNSDSVCLPACVIGVPTTIVNKGSHTLAVFPQTGGHIWSGSGATDLGANTAQSLAVCGSGACLATYTCTDGTQVISSQ